MRKQATLLIVLCLLLAGCAPSVTAPDSPVSAPPAEMPAPTPAATPRLTPVPTATPVPDALLAEGLLDAFFDDAVFIGDSVTNELRQYVIRQRAERPDFLGAAKFVCCPGYRLSTAASGGFADDGKNLAYRGQFVTPVQAVEQSGASWVFLQLGINGLAGMHSDRSLAQFERVIDRLLEECPGIHLVVQALTPLSENICNVYDINSLDWNAFNHELEALCNEKGVFFLDINTAFCDENGYLNPVLSRDQSYHFNSDGNAIYAALLRSFVRARYEAGDWTPGAAAESAPTGDAQAQESGEAAPSGA